MRELYSHCICTSAWLNYLHSLSPSSTRLRNGLCILLRETRFTVDNWITCLFFDKSNLLIRSKSPISLSMYFKLLSDKSIATRNWTHFSYKNSSSKNSTGKLSNPNDEKSNAKSCPSLASLEPPVETKTCCSIFSASLSRDFGVFSPRRLLTAAKSNLGLMLGSRSGIVFWFFQRFQCSTNHSTWWLAAQEEMYQSGETHVFQQRCRLRIPSHAVLPPVARFVVTKQHDNGYIYSLT